MRASYVLSMRRVLIRRYVLIDDGQPTSQSRGGRNLQKRPCAKVKDRILRTIRSSNYGNSTTNGRRRFALRAKNQGRQRRYGRDQCRAPVAGSYSVTNGYRAHILRDEGKNGRLAPRLRSTTKITWNVAHDDRGRGPDRSRDTEALASFRLRPPPEF